MTRLIVSVRSALEALEALAGGADLIDVKEPNNGSLGAASCDVLREVACAVAGRRPLSAALGELHEMQTAGVPDALEDYSFAKIGLANTSCDARWREGWSNAVAGLPDTVSPVGVVYADALNAQAPAAEDVIDCASSHSCGAVLVDTYVKDGTTLLDHWTPTQLRQFIEQAKQHDMLSVVAGALDQQNARAVVKLNPDFVAVRSAVCRGERIDSLCRDLVADMASAMRYSSLPVGTTN